MNAKKMVAREKKALLRSIGRRSCGNVGGLKLLPSQIHEPSTVRIKNVPVVKKDNQIDLDFYEDYDEK